MPASTSESSRPSASAPSWHVVLTGPRAGDQRREALDFVAVSAGHRPGTWEVTHRCPHCGSDQHGSPALQLSALARRRALHLSPAGHDDGPPPPRVSFSRAGGWLATAWLGRGSETGRGQDSTWRVGVDLETIDSPAFATADGLGPADDSVGFSTGEIAAIGQLPEAQQPAVRATLWAVKEATVKALGTGFDGDPADIVVGYWDDRQHGVVLNVPGHPEAQIHLGDQWPGGDPPDGQIGAVVLLRHRPD